MINGIIRTYRTAYSGLPREVWLISLVVLVNRCGAMVLPFLSLYLTEKLSWQPSMAGTLLSVYGIGAIVGSYAGGWLTTRIGSIRAQVVSLSLAAPGFILVLHLQGYWQIALCILYVSTMTESVRPATSTATSEFCEPRLHSRAFALNRLAANLGFSIGPAVGGILFESHFPLLFYLDGATCLLAAAVLLMCFNRGRIVAKSESTTVAIDSRPLSPWRDRQFLVVMGLTLLTELVFFQLLSTFPLYLHKQFSIPESRIGFIIAVNTITIVVLEMVLVHWVQRFRQLISIGWGCFLICLGYGLLPFGSGLSWCVFTVLIWTFGEMLSMPLTAAYVSGRTVVSNRGSYMGIMNMTFSIGAVGGPIIGMWLYERDPNLPWYASLVMGLVVLAAFHLVAFRNERACMGAASSSA